MRTACVGRTALSILVIDSASPSSASDALRFLFVRVAGHRFCLRLDDVERLLPLMLLQPVPEGPDYLMGLMNLRGQPVPVVDLARRLGLPACAGHPLEAPVVLAGLGGLRAGLVVDEVLGVQAVPRPALRGEALFRDGLPPVLSAVATNGGTALQLDTLRILDIDLSGLTPSLVLEGELLALCRQAP